MCSGCAGDYEGDFEGSARPAFGSAEANSGAWISDRPRTDAKPLGSRAAGPFEGAPDWEGNSATANCAGPTLESHEEICEILVSATRIVELRVITVNVARIEIDKLPGTKMAAIPAARQQSTSALAKYYQTHGADPENHNHRARSAVRGWLVVGVLSGPKRFLQRARRAFGNHTSRIPE